MITPEKLFANDKERMISGLRGWDKRKKAAIKNAAHNKLYPGNLYQNPVFLKNKSTRADILFSSIWGSSKLIGFELTS